MDKIRWGIISTANIGTGKVIPAMQAGQYCEIVAIASRNPDTARVAADRLGIPKAYGSYGELLADDGIDAVYNPLPNHLHVPWSVKALEAGKHVLCEKPLALTAVEGQELLEAARVHPRLKVMEAFMYRHHPQWARVKELLAEGGVGELRAVHSFFAYYNVDPANIRNIAAVGGGALMDVGCYCISQSRYVFGAEPTRASGVADFDPAFKTDRQTSGILEFDTGAAPAVATFTCATQLAGHQRVTIMGTEGRIEVETPFTPAADHVCRLLHTRGGQTDEILVDAADQYMLQGDNFSRAVLDDTPVPTPLEDAVHNMRAIEAVFRAAEAGESVAI